MPSVQAMEDYGEQVTTAKPASAFFPREACSRGCSHQVGQRRDNWLAHGSWQTPGSHPVPTIMAPPTQQQALVGRTVWLLMWLLEGCRKSREGVRKSHAVQKQKAG